MKYFKKTMTVQEVKNAYRKAAMALHPDKGGSVQVMQELNTEFEIAFMLAQKCNPAQSETADATETATEYRRQFYTANGWQGSRYDRKLTTKDIAKIMREYVKNVYPTYRFSITATVRGIRISLMEYPVELTNRDMLLHYYYTEPTIRHDGETQTDIENWLNHRLETAEENGNFPAKRKSLKIALRAR